MSEKSRQFLYNEFSKAGLGVGTFEEFDSLVVNNAESRNWAKAQAERLGFDTTDFDRKMTEVSAPQAPAPRRASIGSQFSTIDDAPYAMEQPKAQADAHADDTPAQKLARTKEKTTSNNAKAHTYSAPALDTDVLANEYKAKANQARQAGDEQAAKQAEQAAQAIIEGKAVPIEYLSYTPPTQEEIEARVKEIEARIDNPQTPEDYALRRQEKVRRNAILGTRNFGLDMTMPKYNSLSGIYTYTDPITKEEEFYDKAGFKYDNIFDAEAGSQNYDAMVRASKQKADYLANLDKQIAQVEEQIKQTTAEQTNKLHKHYTSPTSILALAASETGGERITQERAMMEMYAPEETKKLGQLRATLADLQQMQKTIQASQDLKFGDGFFDWNNAKNIWRGLTETWTDPHYYASFMSFGLNNLDNALTTSKVFEKVEKGEKLTDAETQLALASAMNKEVQSTVKTPMGYGGGKIGAEALPFMLQMILNPGSGITKSLGNFAVSKFGKSGAKAIAARVLARGLGATAEAAVLTNTIQAGSTAADLVDRMNGDVTLGYNQDGYLVPDGVEDKKSFGRAFYEAETKSIIENFTELIGLPGAGKLINATAKGLEKLGLKNVRNVINTMSHSQMSKFLEKAGWHGPVGEFGEELMGMGMEGALIDPKAWEGLTDPTQLGTIAIGVSLFGGLASTYRTASASVEIFKNTKAERNLKSTNAIAVGLIGADTWNPIREKFNNSTDTERETLVAQVMGDKNLSPEAKKASLAYFCAVAYYEGRNIGKAQQALEERPTATQRAIKATEEAHQQGMLAEDPSTQYDIIEAYKKAENAIRAKFGWDETVDVADEVQEFFGSNETDVILGKLLHYTDDVQDLFADYLFARTKYDGMMQGQQQRVDAGATELEERLNAEAHSARQEMVSATLADGSSCTIIGGNFEIKDGVIDLTNSDQAIVIMQDGKKRMITADQVGNVTTMPIEQVINEQVTAYRQQADTEFENGINLVAQSRQQAEMAEQQQAQAEQPQAEQEQPQAEEQTTEVVEEEPQQPTIPVDAKGNPLYEQATPELVVQDIYDNQGLPADIATQFVDNKLEEAKKIAEKLAKKEPKIGTNIAQYKEAMVQWQQATTEAQSNIAFWEEVKAVASQRNQPTEETAPTTEETAPVVEVEEQAEETTEAEQPTEETAKEVTLETEEVAEEQTPIAESATPVAETEDTPEVEQPTETAEEAPQAETTEQGQPTEEETPQVEEVAEETETPQVEEEQPQAEQTEEVTEEYINEVIDKLRDVYESLANEAQTDINNNLESFKAELSSRSDEEIASAIADIESTPILGKLFERVRNGLLSGEIKGTEQEEQDLTNALQRIAQGNVAKNTLLPILKAEQQKRAEQQAESKTEPQPKAKAKPKATPKAKATPKTTAKAKTPKRKKEVNFFKYILPKKERELRPVLAGVFMRDGYRVASDTHILIAERAEYSPALEGRVINEDGIALVDKKGNPIINNLSWQRVIPTPENSSLVLTPIESIMAMIEQAKPLNKIFADDAPYNGNTATEIEIETENGPAFFDSAKLALFMDFVLTIDNPTLAYGNNSRSIWVTSADGSKKAVLMGLASESDRVGAIRISTRKGIEVGADFSYNNKKTNELKSELKESEDYIALMKAQPVPPRRELSFHEKKVAQLKALIAIREGKTDLADTEEDARRKPLRQRAKEWEQKTGTKVVIVEDETEIEQESARRQVAESKVMGWYNRKSGEVYLYMPNLMSEEEIDNTFVHEVVIHKGLRGLLKPKAYNSVMQRVFDSLSPEQQAKWLKYPGVKGDAIKAADEYIANTFESLDVENASLWQKFVDAIRAALINMGIRLKATDATLSSLIRQSYRKMAEQKAMEIPTEMIEVANDIPADASAETQFSIKIAHALNEKSMEYAQQKGVSEEFMDSLRKAEADINQMAERIKQDLGGDLDAKRRGKRMLPEEVNVQDGKPLKGYSTIFKNGSYGRTMENTLKCLRTLAYIDFVNDVKERIGRPLTSQESFLASQMLYDISVDPQCLYCYVSLDRKAYDEFLIRYLNQRDAVIAAYDSLSAQDKKNPKIIDELYQDFLASRKDTKEMKRRFNMWIDARKAGLPLLSASDVATTTRRDNIRNNGDAPLKAQLKDAEAYAQGASWAKKEDEYRAYTGEILRMPQSTINMLNKEYGLRFYSFSEYSPAFIVENMQMIRDAAIRGLRGLAYTKETDFVKIFAPSQININVSVFGRRDANGNMVADTRQGADWAEAKALRKQYPNVGAVFVATNDADVEWALAQDWIDVVIPFHIVRTGADIANFYEWVNYSSEQADKDAKGRKADISPVEHLNSKERYMQLVEERNLTPRFAKWSDNPNYMKLVNETRRPYNQTPTLTPSFMLNEALTSWNEFNEKGGYYGGWYNVDEQGYQDAVAQVTEDIQEGRTAKDVDYGRQDVPADAWNTKRQTREQRIHRNAPLINAPKTETTSDEDIAFSVADDAVSTADTFTSAAEAIAQQLGVEIEIDESMPAKGSYNPRTGRIRINPSRHATAEDVQRTVLHETIGHGGIQAVAGKRFGQVCQQVYDMMSDEQRADIRSRHGNLSDEAVGAEYMAEMAEKGKVDITTWEKVKAMVRNMLMSMGINLNLTDADIRYMLYSAHQLAEKGKLQDSINRATTLGKLRRQAELSHDVAEDAMSRPLMRPVDPDLEGLTTGELGITDVQLMDLKAVEEMLKNTKLAKANSIGLGTLFSTVVTDRTLPIAKFVQQVFGYSSITKAYTHDPENNPHIWANLAPSKAMRRAEVFRQTLQKDLFRTFHLMAAEWRSNNQGFSADYATAIARLYAVAKTAQERQAIKGKGLNDVDYAGVTGVLKWIGMTVKTFNGHILKPINWSEQAEALGLDSHQDLSIEQCATILAQNGYPSITEFIESFEKQADTAKFWEKTNEISHSMLKNQLEAGLLSPTSYQILMYGKSFVEIAKAKGLADVNMLIEIASWSNVQQMVDANVITQEEADAMKPYYEHYLPLKGSTDIEQGKVIQYGRSKIKVKGKAVKEVTGHTQMVKDPIAQLCYDYSAAIYNEEENKWKLKLLGVVRFHESTTTPKDRQATVVRRNQTGEMGAFQEVRVDPRLLQEHDVIVYENGTQKIIRFANKHIADAANPEQITNNPIVRRLLNGVAWLNRYFSQVFTSRNPAFIIPNIVRDIQSGQEFNTLKSYKQGELFGRLVTNEKTRRALFDEMFFRGKGTKSKLSPKYQRYIDEFLANGALTSITQMPSFDELTDILKATQKSIRKAKSIDQLDKQSKRGMLEWLTQQSAMAENLTRLATFIAARECGKSVSLAALEAKEVSVNFDRKGNAYFRELLPLVSIFQNAAIQSLRRIKNLVREKPARFALFKLTKTTLSRMIGFFGGFLLSGMGADDDEKKSMAEYAIDYFSVNSHTASSNTLIPTRIETISIPVALDDVIYEKIGFVIMKRLMLKHYTGQAYTSEENIGDDITDLLATAAQMAGTNPLTNYIQTFTPAFEGMSDGDKLLWSFSSTPAVSAPIQLYVNRDYKGDRLYKEPINEKYDKPDHTYDFNKKSVWHKIAVWLNEATGGNDVVGGYIDISGTALEQFVEQYAGGFGDIATKTAYTVEDIKASLTDGKIERYGQEREVTLADYLSDIPVLHRFNKVSIDKYHELGIKDHVFRLYKHADGWRNQIKDQYKAGNFDWAKQLLAEKDGYNAQDYFLALGRRQAYDWSKEIPNAKKYYESLMDETYFNDRDYSLAGKANIIIGQASLYKDLTGGNFDAVVNPNPAIDLYEDITKKYIPKIKKALKEETYEEAMATISDINATIVAEYYEYGKPKVNIPKLEKEDE